MPHYVRVIHRGRGFNVRVELPDGTTQLVNRRDFENNWTCVPRNTDATPYVHTRHSNTENSVESEPSDRRYIRVLHRGRGQHVRLLLPDGTTYLANANDLPNWTMVDPSGNTLNSESSNSTRPLNHGFVNPDSQADRIYEYIVRRGSRNTSVCLFNGSTISIPNEFLDTWLRRGSSAYHIWDEQTNYPNGRELRHLTFGIELEFVADPYQFDAFCDAMIHELGNTRFSRPDPNNLHYGQSSTTQWVLGYDNSVRPTQERDQNKKGYELTSPILKYEDACKQELATVLRLITSVFKGFINRTCGTHIHIGNFMSQIDYRLCSRFQHNYGLFEENVFDRLVSPSRKGNGNHYCQSCNTTYIDGRYYKINLQNLNGFGTIENRQHMGTLDLKKIWSWMELNGRYITSFFHNPERFECINLTLEQFFNKINLSQETQQFYFAREAELN